jgi:hypothetical protein
METRTVGELQEAKAYVEDRLIHRSFAEHPEDRIELMHKAESLDNVITRYMACGADELSLVVVPIA